MSTLERTVYDHTCDFCGKEWSDDVNATPLKISVIYHGHDYSSHGGGERYDGCNGCMLLFEKFKKEASEASRGSGRDPREPYPLCACGHPVEIEAVRPARDYRNSAGEDVSIIREVKE